jgi:hypothetical protein
MHAILVRDGPPWSAGLSYAFGDGAEHFLNQWMEDTFGQRIPDAAEEGDALRDWELDVGRRLIEREGPAW